MPFSCGIGAHALREKGFFIFTRLRSARDPAAFGICRGDSYRYEVWIQVFLQKLEGGKHQTFDLGFVTVEAVKAGYNRWHNVKECVGYIVTLSDEISIYVTGDTSKTEQILAEGG